MFAPFIATESNAEPVHAIAMHGEPKYQPSFKHFDYVNPHAPKGGRLTIGEYGSFDSLNPLIIKGQSGAGIRELLFESLLARGRDEPFTLYGQIAQLIDMPDDRSSITFHLNKNARFSDGHPINTDDVVFSWKVLRDRGRPNHRTYYAKVARTQRHDDHKVTFYFDDSGDRELPLILGLMPVLPAHIYTPDSFEKTTLVAPIGSGAYKISKVEPGRTIMYTRDPNWWGRALPVNKGRFNFDQIRFEYFRDSSAMFEAFKSGLIDIRNESSPSIWAKSYDFPAAKVGDIIKSEFEIGLPAGMLALVFNTRREQFKDPIVRKALIHMFDFNWINKSLYHGLYDRTQSFFERSMLSSALREPSPIELSLLAPYPNSVTPTILDGTDTLPTGSDTGQNRENWRAAVQMLATAGYKLRNGKMIHTKTNKQLAFEMLAVGTKQERLFLSFARDLDRIGISVTTRVVDSAQYQSRLSDYDYDIIQNHWGASLSPGNEQLFRWSSKLVDQPGTYNFAGVSNPAADAMIQAMLRANSSNDFVAAVRALDRVLRSGHYVVPLFHLPKQWVAHWKHIAFPKQTPLFGYQVDTLWHTEASSRPPKDPKIKTKSTTTPQ